MQAVIPDYDVDAGELAFMFPSGEVVSGHVELGDEIQTNFFGSIHFAKELWDRGPTRCRRSWAEPVRLVAAPGVGADRGRGGSVSLMSRASLRRLAEVAGVGAGRRTALSHADRGRGRRRPRRGRLGPPQGAHRLGAGGVARPRRALRHHDARSRQRRGRPSPRCTCWPPTARSTAARSRCRSGSTARCSRAVAWPVGDDVAVDGPMSAGSSPRAARGRRGRRPRRGGHADAARQAQRARRGDVRADHRRRRPTGREAGVRAVVLHGEGPSFCSGLDVVSIMAAGNGLDGLVEPRARRRAQLVSARRPRVAGGCRCR